MLRRYTSLGSSVLGRSFVAGAAAACALWARPAAAQSDINPPLPNVLLLVDTSGSMEYKVGTSAFPTCDPTGTQVSEKSRWVDLIEVLTGSIRNYRCERIDRTSVAFRDGEYGVGGPLGLRSYDYLYENPFHRPLSGNCAVGPGALGSDPYQFPDNALKLHAYNSNATTCTYDQARDGILDAFENAIRFGLMTFDPTTDPSTGLNTTGGADHAGGIRGTWSYVWNAAAKANPSNCTDPPRDFEVGSRNAAAPPWEGRLIAFGDPSPGSSAFKTKKAQIEKVLLSSRPFGPTPIAGMLRDARDFLLNDTRADPLDPGKDFGPRNDPYIVDSSVPTGCRKRYIILLSDGQPNMELRPDCEGGNGGVCPFDKPEDVAYALASEKRSVRTFVVGFALAKFNVTGRGQVTCNDLLDSDFDETQPSALCSDTSHRGNVELQACCALNRIAVKGGSGTKPRAFFAANRDQLASALSKILTETTHVTSRTQPVTSGAASGSQGFRFYSSVRPVSFQPWVGILQRQRYTCGTGNVPTPAAVSRDQQDDFAANLNQSPRTRRFAAVHPGNGSEAARPRDSIRPYIGTTNDGVGTYVGRRYVGLDDQFVSNTSAQELDVTDTTCDGNINATACKDRYLNWLVGRPNGTEFTRCRAAGTDDCYLFGDILHSTPRVVGPPSDFLRDESYERFALQNRYRPVVLYTSTNDGFLHAFKVAPSDPTDTDKVLGPGPQQNELWAFVPPAVLPEVRRQFPFSHYPLLDGVPVVRDVVATRSDPSNVDSIRFERLQSDVNAGQGTWRTVLVQSFGNQSPAGGGYFALDVTQPVLDTSNSAATGPRFLWQLTNVANKPLFGTGGTPAITTLYFRPANSSTPLEIPVAILPGGPSRSPGTNGTGTGCPTTDRTYSGFSSTGGEITPRPRVLCYTAEEDRAARSLTIVRLDTGEIVRTFRQSKTEIASVDLQARVIEAGIDSPITGQPVAFPSDTGAIADRAYVGDQDGRMWRVDLSSTNPSNWKMELFFDAFPRASTIDSSLTFAFGGGQPIVLPPIVSVDERGDITVNIATGDQDTVGASASVRNFVWSVTERTSADRTLVSTKVNWFQPFSNGERTVGPMSLFNSQLFFTTYAPPGATSSACSPGTSKVWGMDYLRPLNYATETSPAKNRGGHSRLPSPSGFVQSLTAQTVAGNSNAVIFGVSVAQEPTCSTAATQPQNDFLGYAADQNVTTVKPGKFQLVMHVGGVENAGAVGDLQANVKTVDLQPPANATRVDSWAALVE